MTDPNWVPLRAVIAIQGELIAEHGGLARPPRQGDLEAALGHHTSASELRAIAKGAATSMPLKQAALKRIVGS